MSNGQVAVIQSSVPVLDADRVKLLSDTIANGAPPLVFDLFVQVCNRTGLDPFAKQIYFIQRGGKWSWQTSIDGYRLIADRTGDYAGSDDPIFVEENSKPVAATVTVYKMVGGQRCPFSATARWSEYYPGEKSGQMWHKMPYLMLGKCAEALALRKAFPAELSGLYTREEMDQAGDYVEVAGETVIKATGEIIEVDDPWRPLIDAAETLDELNEINAGMKESGITEESDVMLVRHWRGRFNTIKIAEAQKTRKANDEAAKAAYDARQSS